MATLSEKIWRASGRLTMGDSGVGPENIVEYESVEDVTKFIR